MQRHLARPSQSKSERSLDSQSLPFQIHHPTYMSSVSVQNWFCVQNKKITKEKLKTGLTLGGGDREAVRNVTLDKREFTHGETRGREEIGFICTEGISQYHIRPASSLSSAGCAIFCISMLI